MGLKNFLAGSAEGQTVSLTINCLKKRGLIIHELGHLIGFYHEHQRPDRDQYVMVHFANISSPFRDDYKKIEFTTYGDYDFDSVMHYPLNHYALAGQSLTVLPNVTVPEGVVIGRRHTLSKGDWQKANRMYECPKSE